MEGDNLIIIVNTLLNRCKKRLEMKTGKCARGWRVGGWGGAQLQDGETLPCPLYCSTRCVSTCDNASKFVATNAAYLSH